MLTWDAWPELIEAEQAFKLLDGGLREDDDPNISLAERIRRYYDEEVIGT